MKTKKMNVTEIALGIRFVTPSRICKNLQKCAKTTEDKFGRICYESGLVSGPNFSEILRPMWSPGGPAMCSPSSPLALPTFCSFIGILSSSTSAWRSAEVPVVP